MYPPKRAGFCTRCGEAVFEILEWITQEDGMVTDRPRRLGVPLPTMTQIEFRLLAPAGNPIGGSRMHLSFCLDCAQAITPREYPALRTCVLAANLQGTSIWRTTQTIEDRRQWSEFIIAGPLWRRTFTAEDPTYRIDRRRDGGI